MRFLTYIASLSTPLLICSFANGAALVTGQTVEEKMTKWLFNHRMQILRSCIADTKACGKKDFLLPQIQKTLASLDTHDSVEFVRESEAPGKFKIGDSEVHRVAVTERKSGAVITFNRDRIKGLKLTGLGAILFHEFAHHTGIADDESRIPDQIGARIAKHIDTQLQRSSFDEGGLSNLEIGVFQTSLKDQYDSVDLSDPLTNFSYLTDGIDLLDVDLFPFVTALPCERNEVVYAQKSQAPQWTIDSQSSDGFSLHISSILTNYCTPPNPRPNLAGNAVEKAFRLTFKTTKNSNIDWKTLIVYLADSSHLDYFDAMKTVKFSNAGFATSKVKAGDLLTLQADADFLTSRHPKNCSVGFFRDSWPLQSAGIHTLSPFSACTLMSKGGDKFQLTATYQIPSGLAPGIYKVYGISVNTDKDPALAILNNLSFEVVGLATPPMTTTTIDSTNFETTSKTSSPLPLRKIGSQPLLNSVVYNVGQEFDYVVDVKSEAFVNRQVLDIGLLVQVGNELLTSKSTAEPKDLGFLVKTTSILKTASGFRVTYHIAPPNQYQGQNLFGFFISRVLIEDQSANWTEIVYPNYDHMALLKSFVDAN